MTRLEENEKFQEFVIKQFTRIDEQFTKIDERFTKFDNKFVKIDERFDHVDKRLGSIENLIKQHHQDTEKMAIQVEQLVTEHDDLTNYFLKRREINKNKQTTTI